MGSKGGAFWNTEGKIGGTAHAGIGYWLGRRQRDASAFCVPARGSELRVHPVHQQRAVFFLEYVYQTSKLISSRQSFLFVGLFMVSIVWLKFYDNFWIDKYTYRTKSRDLGHSK